MSSTFFTGPNARLFAANVAAAQSDRTPTVGALGISVLAHLIPLLLIGTVLVPRNPGRALTKIVAELSTSVAWIPEIGGTSGRSDDARKPLEHEQGLRSAASPSDRPTIAQSATAYDVPVVTTIPDLQVLPGILSPLTSIGTADAITLGPGEREGGGPDGDPGLGGGRGPGTGSGGDPFGVGRGATSPLLIKEVKPSYTSDAMRARLQGTVIVRAIVLPDGSVGVARVVRSLDTLLGLDQEALKAVKLWRFKPGTLGGRPVSVAVDIELTFTLR
jgi:TonB family protein